jgi:hypothetical protein
MNEASQILLKETMSDLLKVTIPASLEPAVRYADALHRYERTVAKLTSMIEEDMKYDRTVTDEFLRAFADYRKAIIADDTAKIILAEEKLFDMAEKHGYAVDVLSQFNSLMLDFSFHVMLLSNIEKEILELIS